MEEKLMDVLPSYTSFGFAAILYVLGSFVTVYTVSSLFKLLVAPYFLLSSHGIRGPRPLPIVGNFLALRKGYVSYLEKQIKVFGTVFGFYVGSSPRIVIADVHLAKEIMVKEFENFTDRGYVGFLELAPKALKYSTGLTAAHGSHWKAGRCSISPSFSGRKLTLMVPLLKKSSEVLTEKMGEFATSGKSVNISEVYKAFTMEAILATAFGRYVDIQRGEADQLTEAARTVFSALEEGNARFSPEVLLVGLSNFRALVEPLVTKYIEGSEVSDSVYTILRAAVGLIQDRRKNQCPHKATDLLQLIINSVTDKDGDGKCPMKQLTTEQIAGFAFEFLLAGYDTTANTLSYTTYLLAMHPDVQEKLQTEIDQYFEEDPGASLYDAIQKLKYLDMVIQETLRFYAPVPLTQRHCRKTVTIGGVTIPAGTDVVVPIHLIHHMPQYWPDPHTFNPERFTAEAKANRPQLAHMPFGWGPRSCIGMRYALFEIKFALIEILSRYNFTRGPETVTNLEQVHGLTSGPKGGVHIKITTRETDV